MACVAHICCLNIILAFFLFCVSKVISFYSVHRMRRSLPTAWAVVGSAILTRNGHMQRKGRRWREGKRKREKKRERHNERVSRAQVDCCGSPRRLTKGGGGTTYTSLFSPLSDLYPLPSPLYSLLPLLSSLCFSPFFPPSLLLSPLLSYHLFLPPRFFFQHTHPTPASTQHTHRWPVGSGHGQHGILQGRDWWGSAARNGQNPALSAYHKLDGLH